jgi:hypothetical protein
LKLLDIEAEFDPKHDRVSRWGSLVASFLVSVAAGLLVVWLLSWPWDDLRGGAPRGDPGGVGTEEGDQ